MELFQKIFVNLVEKFPIMLYDSPLYENVRKDFHPKPAIEESIRGVEVDFYYTGKRLGKGTQIELHLTSIVRDWEETVYIRKSWYTGNKKTWRECIEKHITKHLQDLSVEPTIVKGLMRDFEIREEHFRTWEKYDPEYFNKE